MAASKEKKVVCFELRWLVTSIGATCVVVLGGFWAFYSFNISAAKSDFQQQLANENRHMSESSAQIQKSHYDSLESLRRESIAKLEALQLEHKAKLRELELTNQGLVTQLESQARRDKESLNQVIDGLRQKLSVSRSSLEISASGDFLSVNELLIDDRNGRQKMTEGNFVNSKRLLLPDYAGVGWEKIEGVSIAQVNAFMRERVIKFRPEEVSTDDIDWHPLFTVWCKSTKDSVGLVGAAQLSKKEFVEFLQRANTTTTTAIKNSDGTTSKSVETVTIDAKKVAKIPLSISAYSFIYSLVFANDPSAPTDVSVTSFSARTDAMHFAATIEGAAGRKYDSEILIMQDKDDTFVLVDIFSAENWLDPITREATDWLRNLRIVKEKSVK